MLINIWRYSHFLLAVFSFLFLFIASVTGIILSAEPIAEQAKPYSVSRLDTVSLAEVIPVMNDRYEEILSLQVNEHHHVIASVISMEEGFEGDFYMHPETGEKTGDVEEQQPLFQWATALHRSLFLKTTGRILIGVASFLLMLIAFSGFILIIQRTNGLKHFFKTIIKQNSSQYYHTITGRIMLVPVFLIALTGTYLFLAEMSLLPQHQTEEVVYEPTEREEREINEFPVFQETSLADVRSLEFPFSSSEEDYFILTLKKKELRIHQFTGEIVSEQTDPFVEQMKSLSLFLHTGRGSVLWALILGLACVNILYFMYSGARISWRRLSSKVNNEFSADTAEYILLVGSENGSTRRYASVLYNELLRAGKKAFIDDLNHYQAYPKASELLVITSTYGDGEPPSNASRFLEKLEKVHQPAAMDCSVVGFGSLAYPQYCQFALDAFETMKSKPFFQLNGKPFLIHNQSFTSFKLFVDDWALDNQLNLSFPNQLKKEDEKRTSFQVLDKQVVNDGYSVTFLLEITMPENQRVQSGDLLAVLPEGEHVERLYSVGVSAENKILLSIKLHEKGLCSQFLFSLAPGDRFEGRIQQNEDFHQPKQHPVVFIANGTGIAPFLGMIHSHPKQEKTLYFGGRNYETIALYEEQLQEANQRNTLTTVRKAYSRLRNQPSYVQELIVEDAEEIVALLENKKATILICGSVTMQNGVLKVLEKACETYGKKPLSQFIANGQVLMDCY